MRPTNIHFVTGLREDFGGKPFILPHLLAILSAKMAYPDHEIFVHLQYEPSGRWWDIAKRHVSLVHVEAPTEIFGRQIEHFAHAADVVRLRALIEHGGIYFDMDTLVLRSIRGLPRDRVVMGQEVMAIGRFGGLCNAFIAAPKDAAFLKIWLENYASFDGSQWSFHSVQLPSGLATRHPELIHVEPSTSFFYPHADPGSLQLLFERAVGTAASYSIHLWESLSWDYLKNITPAKIMSDNTTYCLNARAVLRAFFAEIAELEDVGVSNPGDVRHADPHLVSTEYASALYPAEDEEAVTLPPESPG